MSEPKDDFDIAKERIIQEMEKDERYQKFFGAFREDSVKSFIQQYAWNKAMLEVRGNIKENVEEGILEEWQDMAWECIEEIQQKKLFDLSCQWYADRIKNLPEVSISLDFPQIGERILDYTGITPISESELDFYLHYLREEKNVLTYYRNRGYQEYNNIRKQYELNSNTEIDYYDYHNQQTGNDGLLQQRALHLEKEQEYMEIGLNERRKKTKKKVVKKGKPSLGTSDEELIEFARKFKDNKTANFIEALEECRSKQPDSEQEWAIFYLNDLANEHVPVSSMDHWADALIESAVAHRQEQMQEMLPSIYQEYLMKISNGIPFTMPDKKARSDFYYNWFRTNILDGRELSGEPRNFDY